MKYFTLLASLLFSLPSFATIFIVAYDPQTGAMGQAVSSSGPAYVNSTRFQVRQHGVGIVGAGGRGMCGRARPKLYLSQHLSAREIASRIANQCDRAEPYYRLAIVTAAGDVHVQSGPDGCNSHNRNCSVLNGDNLGVIGGGLQAGVAQNAFDHFNSLSPQVSLECRLYSTLQNIYANGGEFKNFKVANIVVSYPSRSRTNVWQSTGKEVNLLGRLKFEMKKSGVDCSRF